MSCFGRILINFGPEKSDLTYSCSVTNTQNNDNRIVSDSIVYGGACDFYFTSELGSYDYTFTVLNMATNEVLNIPFTLNSNCC